MIRYYFITVVLVLAAFVAGNLAGQRNPTAEINFEKVQVYKAYPGGYCPPLAPHDEFSVKEAHKNGLIVLLVSIDGEKTWKPHSTFPGD